MIARALAPVIVGVAMAVAAGVAHAQAPGPAPTPAPAPAPGPAPAPDSGLTVPADPKLPDAITAPPGFEADPAWAAYDGAFRDAAAGNINGAKARLAELATRWPGHPAQARAAALAERLEARRDLRNPKTDLARGELVFWSTLGSVVVAAQLCVAIDCTSDREYAGVYTLTIGGALAASMLASRHGVGQAEVQLYNSAQTWGAWNALLVNDGYPDDAKQASIAIGMQLGGLAAGVGLWQLWRPTQGNVALANTFLVWGAVMTVWGYLAGGDEPTLRTVIGVSDASLLAGALLSRYLPMSRGRTLVIDLSGILGTLAGGLVASASQYDTTAGISLMAGTAGGLVVGFFTSRSWDKPSPVQVAPAVIDGAHHSKGYGLSAGFSF